MFLYDYFVLLSLIPYILQLDYNRCIFWWHSTNVFLQVFNSSIKSAPAKIERDQEVNISAGKGKSTCWTVILGSLVTRKFQKPQNGSWWTHR